MIKRFDIHALSLVATVLLAATTQAHSQAADEPISVSVQYGDLDIGHAAGAKVLLQRIEAASVRACGGEPDLRVLQQHAAYNQCRKTAVGEAVAQIGSPIVTALANHDRLPVGLASR
jgi:UrcA family protein